MTVICDEVVNKPRPTVSVQSKVYIAVPKPPALVVVAVSVNAFSEPTLEVRLAALVVSVEGHVTPLYCREFASETPLEPTVLNKLE